MLSVHDILTLLSVRGIGRRTVHRAIEAARNAADPANLIDLLSQVKRQGGRVTLPNGAAVSDASDIAHTMMGSARSQGISILIPGDAAFPQRLSQISDAPVVLFTKGRTELIKRTKCLAIVGTRHPTSYGKQVATRLAQRAVARDFVVVSGLAEGIDAAAHEGCLSSHGETVAILAHGLDRVYPAIHTDLAEKIVNSGGCLVSEYPPSTRMSRGQFVDRNRLQSGISLCVIVVETDVRGGTMHTVKFAKNQGRTVACVRHPSAHSGVPQAQGNHQLLSEPHTVALASSEHMDDLLDHLSADLGIKADSQLGLF